MSMKIKRDAFLYMKHHENSPKEEFAQCETCRMYVSSEFFPKNDGNRCVPFGLAETVLPDASCGAYLVWPSGSASPDGMRVHAQALLKNGDASATKEELGYVEREVRCENCVSYDGKGTCVLYQKLNEKMPTTFDLDVRVDEYGCCNAQTPRN